MNDQTLIKTGAIGAAIAAVCCATPLLVITLGTLGLSALTTYLDFVMLPVLAFCLGMVAFGLYMRRQRHAAGRGAEAVDKTTHGT